MKIFLDTNILIDFLADRPPFTTEAIEIFRRAEKGEIKLYTSTHSIATTHYILKKIVNEKHLRFLLSEISEMVIVLDITNSILKKALKSAHRDFEDAVQIACAESLDDINYIISRKLKDFTTSAIPAISVQDLLNRLDIH